MSDIRSDWDKSQRLLRIESALAELWGIHRSEDVAMLSDEQVIVRLVELRTEATREALHELLKAQADIVDMALRVGARRIATDPGPAAARGET